jgi:hypothetical protein
LRFVSITPMGPLWKQEGAKLCAPKLGCRGAVRTFSISDGASSVSGAPRACSLFEQLSRFDKAETHGGEVSRSARTELRVRNRDVRIGTTATSWPRQRLRERRMASVSSFIRNTPAASLRAYFDQSGIKLPVPVNWDAPERPEFVNGLLDRRPWRPVFEAAVTYERATGVIEVVANDPRAARISSGCSLVIFWPRNSTGSGCLSDSSICAFFSIPSASRPTRVTESSLYVLTPSADACRYGG